MNSKTIIAVLVGLLIGAVGMYGINSASKNNTLPTTFNHNSPTNNDSSLSMTEMTTALKGKTGDDFDKTFISEMIMHHQGAINMAKEAPVNAKHEEVKNLAKDIITAQEKEIAQMKQWQKTWGYTQ